MRFNYSKNKNTFLFLAVILFAGGFSACNSKPKTADETTVSEQKAPEADETRLLVDTEKIDSMRIIFTDDESITSFIDGSDRIKLVEELATARYDTAWNKEGIMVKMVAPDYSLVIRYKNENTDNNDWLMIWKDSGRTKFKNVWYILPEDNREPVYRLIDSYRKK